MGFVDNFQCHAHPAITGMTWVVSCVEEAPTVTSQVKSHAWTVQLVHTHTMKGQLVWTSAMVS